MGKRGPKSTVESHPKKWEIGYRIVSLEKYSDISRKYGISEDVLARWRDTELPKILRKANEEREYTPADWLRDLRKEATDDDPWCEPTL